MMYYLPIETNNPTKKGNPKMSTFKTNREIMTQVLARRTTRTRGQNRQAQLTASKLAKKLLNNGSSASSSIFIACKHAAA